MRRTAPARPGASWGCGGPWCVECFEWRFGMSPPCSCSRASTSGQHPEIVRGVIFTIADSLVGRQEELRRIDDALDVLATGRPGAVEIVGAAGIGKTRFLAEAADRADARGHIVLRGAAADLERDIAFWVFIDALDEYVESVEPRRLGNLPDEVTRRDCRASATGSTAPCENSWSDWRPPSRWCSSWTTSTGPTQPQWTW